MKTSQSFGFSSSHIWIWELDYKESWAPKNWCFWTVVLEKTLESPLDCKEIQPVHPKGDQSWVLIGGTDVKAETPIFWPPDAKNWLIGKDPDAGRDWGQEEKGTTQDEMVGWHHWLTGHVRTSSRSWWWPGKSGVLQSMESQRVWHNWVTELNWTEYKNSMVYFLWKLVYVGNLIDWEWSYAGYMFFLLSVHCAWTIKESLMYLWEALRWTLQCILSASSPSFPRWTAADLIAWPGSLSFSPSSPSAPCRPCPFQPVAPPSPPGLTLSLQPLFAWPGRCTPGAGAPACELSITLHSSHR